MSNKQLKFDRLKNNSELKNIIENLKAHNRDDFFIEIIRALTHIEELWYAIKDESKVTKIERRNKLATKIRKLSKNIEDDPDASLFRIMDSKSITTTIRSIKKADGVVVPCPTVSSYLFDIADLLEDITESQKDIGYYFQNRITSQMDIKSFTKREVWRIVHNFPINKKSPNSEIATIVNIVLELASVEEVKPNDIAKMAKPQL